MDVPANNTHICVSAQHEQNTPPTQLSSSGGGSCLFFMVSSSSDEKLTLFAGSLCQVSLKMLC